MYFPKCQKNCLGYYVNTIFTRKYSTYITVPHTTSDEDFEKSETYISKDVLQPTITLFTPTCNILHNISFCLQLREASFDEKKTGFKCIFLGLMTMQFCVGICFRVSGCLLGRHVLVLVEKTMLLPLVNHTCC